MYDTRALSGVYSFKFGFTYLKTVVLNRETHDLQRDLGSGAQHAAQLHYQKYVRPISINRVQYRDHHNHPVQDGEIAKDFVAYSFASRGGRRQRPAAGEQQIGLQKRDELLYPRCTRHED